jgi:hypothetical protein
MQETKTTCDVCGKKIEEEGPDLNLSACLMQDVGKEEMEEREIELEDLCVPCANALYGAIKPILLRRQQT